MQRVNNLFLSLDENESLLRSKAAKELNIKDSQIKYLKIVKKSLDARRKTALKWVYSVDVSTEEFFEQKKAYDEIHTDKKIVVVGLGPCGLFCALNLARRGLKPVCIERGESVDNRKQKVDSFFKGGSLDTNSNIQFGEGGAGTFSDGKLNTQVNNPLIGEVLKDFVDFGAPEDIAYLAKPHIGSDKLASVVKNIRNEIIRLGGEVRFSTKLEKIILSNQKITGVSLSNGEKLDCDYLVLAIGHSSRDTFRSLLNSNVAMEQKAFAVGLRCEQLQDVINERQFGVMAKNPALGAADYKLVSHASERGVFSFCMCPGGYVVAATSEEGGVVTNGMSNYARDAKNANSAIVCEVRTSDFASESPLAGVDLQIKMERMAFELGGKNYSAPIQLAEDFIADRPSTKLKGVLPTYSRGYEFAKLDKIFPDEVSKSLKISLKDLDNKLKGVASMGAVLTGVESRTSSPLRILRNENFESINVGGLYPAGEGCGYAGGIMSASVDGIKVANAICEKIVSEI